MGDIMGIKYDKIIFWGDVQQFFDGAHICGRG